MDLDKAFNEWKLGRLKYPELRRKSEDDFFGELVARITEIESMPAVADHIKLMAAIRAKDAAEAEEKRKAGLVAKEREEDKMAKARAALKAKREAERVGAT